MVGATGAKESVDLLWFSTLIEDLIGQLALLAARPAGGVAAW
jgi:hypothetical protein